MKAKDIVVKGKMQKYKEINDISLKDLNNKKFYDKVEEIIHNYVSGVEEQGKWGSDDIIYKYTYFIFYTNLFDKTNNIIK